MLRFGWFKDLMIKLCMPFLIPYGLIKAMTSLVKERNGLKTDEICKKLHSVKNVEMIPDIPTDLIRKRAKELSTPQRKITFNDIIMTAISKTVNDYLKEKTNDKTS